MTDIRSRDKKISAKNVNDLKFEVKRDIVFTGFKVIISWNYDVKQYPGVVAFRIYKATMSKPKLKKDYLITQRALEKTTGVAAFPTRSNVLYNKSAFSQNSKLKFDVSNSKQHDKQESSLNEYNYSSLHMIRPDFNKTNYTFEDRNIKFGESYSYYITALTTDLKETVPVPVLVNVENLSHPQPPSMFEANESERGILLIIGNNQDRNITKFKVFKREDSEKNFELLTEIDNSSENVYFLDTEIFPKKHYVYRVYSEDLFGSISLYGTEKIATFRYIPITTNIEYQPSVQIDGDSKNGIRIRIRNERPDKVSSVRIERRDDWRFERKFEVKNYNEIPWPNNHFFVDNIVDFIDRNISPGHVYSYRITSFNKAGFPVSYFTTPPMEPGEIKGVINKQTPESTPPKILSFDVDIINSRQVPIFIKCSWRILGDWSYLLLDDGSRKIKIDNFHQSAFIDGFLQNKRYSMFVEVFGLDGKKSDEYRNIILSI